MRYYYHISINPLHEINSSSVTLLPRPDGCYRPCHEPSDARICVAPSVPHCMIALGSMLTDDITEEEPVQTVYIYRTKYMVTSVQPYDVEDAVVTKERWLIEPTEFLFIDSFDIIYDWFLHRVLYKLEVGNNAAIPEQRIVRKKLYRYLKERMKCYEMEIAACAS